MKKTNLLLILSVLALFFSCKENDMNDFTGKDCIYFQLSSNWAETKDSLSYTFAGSEASEATINLRVDLMGQTSDRDRKVKLKVVADQTTATEGTHYKALEDSYILKAGENQMNIPITLYNTDKALEEKSVKLTVDLQPSEDLDLGINGRTRAVIIFSNIMSKPSYWEEGHCDWYFGAYSKVKHECFIRELGMDFPATFEEYYANIDYWQQAGIYMSQYFKDNYPVYDENGKAIEPWF